MFNKINISKIVRNHLDTLQNENTGRPDFDDYLTFAIVPFGVMCVLLWFDVFLTDNAINIIITTLSILVGLLFNVVVLIFDIIKRDASSRLKNTVLKQILANIAYTILISVVSILLTLLTFLDNAFAKLFFTSLVYFCLTNFTMTVLMLLKRMFHLFQTEMDELDR